VGYLTEADVLTGGRLVGDEVLEHSADGGAQLGGSTVVMSMPSSRIRPSSGS